MSLKIAQSLLLDSFNSSSVELDDTFLVSDNLNLSITSNNISNNETFGEDYTRTEKVFWALLLIPLPLVAVIGNILVILSVYKERSLQTVTNYFIVSLAFADLLVAAVVMPFAVYVLNSWTVKNMNMC
ncbi:UNVERIFIED_CONTAM: Dop2R [Trichonephila clavipes]